MATFASSYSGLFSSMESMKRKDATELNCRGVPLPYLIRPRKPVIPFDNFGLYNDYATQMDNESDEDVSPMEAVETGSLNKKCFGGNCFGLGNDSNASLSEMDCEMNGQSDEEYVIVGDVDVVMPDSEKKRVGAIHMMELAKALPKSDDEGSSSGDEWVVV